MAQTGLPPLPAGNNLALTYQETLTSIVRLKANRQQVNDAQHFRVQFIEALKLANEEGRRRGYSDETIREARFSVVAFLDETVLNLRNAIFSDWARRPLQEELFGVHMGGEVFFQNLESLMRQPDSAHLADVLEVYLLCLTLGYAGRYSIAGRGELLSLKQSLMSRIHRIRGVPGDLSPHWRPGAEPGLDSGGDPWVRPLLYSALGCLILLLLLFGFYKFSLASAARSVAVVAQAGDPAMKWPLTIGLGAIAWVVLAWAVPPSMHLPANKTLALRLILAIAGLLIAGGLLWYGNRKKRSGAGSPGGSSAALSPLEAMLREAEAKLAASAMGRTARLSTLPVIFITGPNGSMKTTAVLQSELEPELLAGQVHQEGVVVPTAAGNAWLARGAVLVEIGADFQADPKTWGMLSRHVQPSKFEAALGKSAGAPRAVVVCYECENLLKPGAAEAAVEAGKAIRGQLGELASQLGSNLPVYVLFTKLDRVAFFFDFVRNFDRDESRQILGAALPVEKPNAGVYGERETARLTQAFHELIVSLGDRRTELLTREGDAAATLSAYEFPREFRKLRSAAIRFLVEICRPSQLSTGPFLRGFYFSGVRPVVVNEEVATEIEKPHQAGQQMISDPDATSIFSYQRAPTPAPLEAPAQRASRRRIPEWVFLPGLFRDVVLGDRSGLAASTGSTKTNFPRRLLLASIVGLCLLLGVATLVSFLKNRELIDTVRQAAADVTADRPSSDAVSVASLTKLDALRQALVELRDYERTHVPLSLRWGLYTGGEILPDTRRIYFARFKTLLFGDLQNGLVKVMAGWPATPPATADYGYAYSTLKAYLETTSNHDKATMQFLPPLLQQRWAGEGGGVDAAKLALARRQFDFYTSELMAENPYSSQADEPAVAKARQYLRNFGGFSRVYQALLVKANESSKPLIFNQKFAGSSVVVINTFEVPGAFTKQGFAFMENAIKDPAKYTSGEKWVLGEQGPVSADAANLAAQIRAQYDREYINAWRTYLMRSTVVRYASLADAARKLAITSSGTSPLLALFWLASQNTDVSAPPVQQAFRPLHTLMAAASAEQYVVPANTSYMGALTSLQNAIDQASKLPPEQSQAAGDQTGGAASTALLSTNQTALNLGIDPEAHIEGTIKKLMTDPITQLDGVKPNGPSPAPLNAAGADFCAHYRTLMGKFPFDPSAKTQASVEEINGMFRPQQGALWQFYDQKLNKLLAKQGAGYAAVAGQKPELTGRFVGFFNNAASFSNALYAGGASQEPKLNFALQPAFSSDLQSVSLTINGQMASIQPSSGAQRFVWPGNGSGVRLVARSGHDFDYPSYEGLWGLFEFFFDADKPVPSPEWMLKAGRSNKPVTSPLTNQPIAVHFNLDMLGGPLVFQKGYFRELACVAEVAK